MKVAEVYRIAVQEVDQEPYRRYSIAFIRHAINDIDNLRSIQLTKRIDTKIPDPLLSKVVAANVPKRPVLAEAKKQVPQSLRGAVTPSSRPTPLAATTTMKLLTHAASRTPPEVASCDHDLSRKSPGSPRASTGISAPHHATAPPVDAPDSWDEDS